MCYWASYKYWFTYTSFVSQHVIGFYAKYGSQFIPGFINIFVLVHSLCLDLSKFWLTYIEWFSSQERFTTFYWVPYSYWSSNIIWVYLYMSGFNYALVHIYTLDFNVKSARIFFKTSFNLLYLHNEQHNDSVTSYARLRISVIICGLVIYILEYTSISISSSNYELTVGFQRNFGSQCLFGFHYNIGSQYLFEPH